ncbi:MAG TPA: bacterial transcriptional activator domain-containing protein [Gammaproteobacteria bacterium]
MDMTSNLEALIASGKDSAMVRLALASRYWEAGDLERALPHAEAAVEKDPEYSAAWKLLGKILGAAGREGEAIAAYRRGIEVAERRGDRQAAKEMQVFLKRLTPRA